MKILVLEGSEYAETTESTVVPPVTSNVLSNFMEKSTTTKRTVWLEAVREWARNDSQKES